MLRSKEILVLFVLLVGAATGVLGYVIDRRAKNHVILVAANSTEPKNKKTPEATPAATTAKPVDPVASSPAPSLAAPAKVAPIPVALPLPPSAVIELSGANDHKTIDFTSGLPVARDSAEDDAIINAAVKAMDEAKRDIVFKATKVKAPAKP